MRLLASCLFVAACAGRATPNAGAPPPRSTSAPPSSEGEPILDQDDTCPYLPPECLEGHDEWEDTDGCPDPPPPQFALPVGAAALPDAGLRLLNGVAHDARTLVPGARLVIVVEAAPGEAAAETARRAALVERALIDRGVPEARLRLDPGGRVDVEGGDPAPDRVLVRVEGCAE